MTTKSVDQHAHTFGGTHAFPRSDNDGDIPFANRRLASGESPVPLGKYVLVSFEGRYDFFCRLDHFETWDNGSGWLRISNVWNLRNWGTTDKGFGWLALHGPTSQTVLDQGTAIAAPLKSLHHFTDVDYHAWKGYIPEDEFNEWLKTEPCYGGSVTDPVTEGQE